MGWAGRAVAVLAAFMLMLALTGYGQTVVQEKLQKYVKAAEAKTSSNEYGECLEGARELSLKLTYAAVAFAAPALVARKAILRRRLLEVVRFRDFQKHVLVFGPTGSGKTSTALRAVEMALKRNVPVEVIDWKGEYIDRFRGATVVRKIRILEPPDRGRCQAHAMVVVDILRDVLQLTEPMTYMLYEELMNVYEHGRADFKSLLERLRYRRAVAEAQGRYAEMNIAEGLVRRLLPLVLDEERRAVDVRGDGRVVVYDLSDLPTYQLKTIYGSMIMWRVFNEAAKAKSLEVRKLIIAEEAQNYVRPRRAESQPSIGERIVNELRAYGYGAILIAPDPTQLPYHMARDCGAVVSVGYQGLPEVVAELLSFHRYRDVKGLIKTISKLRTYIYYDGRLYIKGAPKPYKEVIDLGLEAEPEVADEAVEELGPSSGAGRGAGVGGGGR